MKIGDMPVGMMLYFGSAIMPDGSVRQDLLWRKASKDNLFILWKGSDACQMDEKEPNSSNRCCRTRGCSFYPKTAVFQYLNSAEENWFTPNYPEDTPPQYIGYKGFLHDFTPSEREVILPQKITVLVPEGFRKEYGNTYELECLVTLPSVSQLVALSGDDSFGKYKVEGETFPICENREDRPILSWTRSAQNGYMINTDADGRLDSAPPYQRLYIRPIILLNPEAEIEQYNMTAVVKSAVFGGHIDNDELDKLLFE